MGMSEKSTDKRPSKFDLLILSFCRLGFAGLMPKMPGTWGTALACILAPFLFLPLDFIWRCIVLLCLFIVGGIAADRAEKILKKKDPGEVVVDELVGVWLAMLPFASSQILLLVAAFLFFRLFDILKPWPVNASENWLPGGFGVMIDDVVAGIYAMICLVIMNWFGWL